MATTCLSINLARDSERDASNLSKPGFTDESMELDEPWCDGSFAEIGKMLFEDSENWIGSVNRTGLMGDESWTVAPDVPSDWIFKGARTAGGEDITATSPPLPSTRPLKARNSFDCWICKRVFSTGDELEIHTIQQDHKIHACKESGCEKAYARRDAFTRHTAKHRLPSRHVCSICEAEFSRKDHLTRHKRVQHADQNAKSSPGPSKANGFASVDIRKVKESELALRRSLSPDSLAIKMLNIVKHSENAEQGVGKAFACVVACAALHAPQSAQPLTPRTQRRLMSVRDGSAIEPEDLGL